MSDLPASGAQSVNTAAYEGQTNIAYTPYGANR